VGGGRDAPFEYGIFSKKNRKISQFLHLGGVRFNSNASGHFMNPKRHVKIQKVPLTTNSDFLVLYDSEVGTVHLLSLSQQQEFLSLFWLLG